MITIGIPCYNQAEYLSDSIESALRQAPKCEIIVVDDGSTDKTIEVASSYPVKLITQNNRGLPSARNTLIMNMTGDYLLPLDADDILMDGCVEKIQKVIDETDADVVAPSFKCFGVENHEVILGNPVLDDFKTHNRIGYFSAIRKSSLLECGGYSPKMKWGYEDYDIWFDLLKRGNKLVTIKEPLVLYRTKEHSMIHDAMKHHKTLMNQIKKNHPTVYE